MRKFALLIVLVMANVFAAMAQVSYDVMVMDKKRVVSGTEDFQRSDDEVFANVLLWAVNEGPGRKDEIVDCDFLKRQMTMVYHLKAGEHDAYICRLGVKVAQGKLVFLVSDIKIQGGLLGAFLNFDRLNPEKKTKHKDIINEFQALNNQKLQDLFNYIEQHNPTITNWKNVSLNKIEKGMTEDEVTIIYGKPISTRTDGAKVQLMYSSFLYVFIENGIVTSFVN